MKKRLYNQIRFVLSGKKTIVLEHSTGEISLSVGGGGKIIPVPCGAGKSVGLVSLVGLFCYEGFVIFVKTQAECRETYHKLLDKGITDAEIMMIYSPCKEDYQFIEKYYVPNSPRLKEAEESDTG